MYQHQTTHYFKQKVNPRKFQVEDWVLRKVSLMTKDLAEGKGSSQLGRSLSGGQMLRERSLSSDLGRWQATIESMECLASEDVLHVIHMYFEFL